MTDGKRLALFSKVLERFPVQTGQSVKADSFWATLSGSSPVSISLRRMVPDERGTSVEQSWTFTLYSEDSDGDAVIRLIRYLRINGVPIEVVSPDSGKAYGCTVGIHVGRGETLAAALLDALVGSSL